MSETTETATFALQLEDQTSGPAEDAALSLERLSKKLSEDTQALGVMQKALRNLRAATTPNAAAVAELTAKIAAQKESVASTQASYVKLGGTFGPIQKKAAGMWTELLSKAKQLPGPLGSVAGKLLSIGGVGLGVAGAIFAVVAATAALVAGTAAAAAALLRYGVAQADARRSELLRLEGLTMLRSRFASSSSTGDELQATIDRVSRSSSLGRERLGAMTTELYRARLRGGTLSDTLQSLATVEAALGEEGARRMRGRIMLDARTGRSAERLASIQERFGSLARRQGFTLAAQSRKLEESFAALFDDVSIDGFLEALGEITELFSQNTDTGRALKSIVDAILPPLVAGITAAMPLAKAFFKGLVIGALLLTLGVLRLKNIFEDTFGGSSLLADVDGIRVAVLAGVVVFGLLAIAVAAVTASFVAFGASVALIFGPIVAVGAALHYLIGVGGRVVAWFRAQDWTGIGRSIVDGLVAGIRQASNRLTQSLRNLGAEARRTIEDVLQIRSPSRVFARLGLQIPRGLAAGIETGSSAATAAVEGLGDDAAGAASFGSSSSTAISVGDIHVHVSGGSSADIATEIRDELVRVLRGLSIQVGAST
jgi:hypothetical protein